VLTVLFDIIIYPVRLLIECIYAVLSVSLFKGNIGVSLAGLSLFVNLLCLPLYTKAEKLQEAEREIQKRMARRITSIKRNFSGDEQYMILSMYYRENHYHPVMALRSSLSLVLQIPFFIAAYSFLAHLDSLTGKSLFFIRDLSAADALFAIHNISINLLPIIMTIINVIAGLIYSKGFSRKEKFQLYLISLVFLVLLYNSPSALVLYWTMNNIFSLVKNILFKTKDPKKVVYIAGCILCAAFMVYILFFRYNHPARAFRNKTFSVIVFVFFAAIPLYIHAARYTAHRWLRFLFFNTKYANHIFLLSCVSIWILTGCFIPFNLVASDPVQFASIQNITSPFSLLVSPAIQAAGLFLFWPVYLFFLSPRKYRSLISLMTAVLAFCGLANFFIFKGNYGIISQELTFSLPSNIFLAGSLSAQFINTIICVVIIIPVFFAAFYRKSELISLFMTICILSTVALCVTKLVHIRSLMEHDIVLREKIANTPPRIQNNTEDIAPVFSLSRSGKNVFVIMLDEGINSYFPLLLREKPDLLPAFNGFTHYPNTVSFYGRTIFGVPPLFGGYEYTTWNMNKRSGEKMKDKHNEAMLMLPELFKQNNFKVTVTDMPYINYEGTMDPDFYLQRGINAQNIEHSFSERFIHDELGLEEYNSESIKTAQLLRRNMLMFALLETSIRPLRDFIYQNGHYWSTTDYSLDAGIPSAVIGSYAELYYLPRIAEITEYDEDTFSIMINNLTHDQTWLQYPDYTITEKVTQQGNNFFENDGSFKHYHVNSAAYLLLAKWFDYLRSEDIWDNTRIIIVSDHGDGGITHPDFSSFQNNHVLPFNPVFLFKDFAENDTLKTNMDFMTSADMPLMAIKDIIKDAVNPFTKKILEPDKKDGAYIFTQGYTNTDYYSGTTCLENNSIFFHVYDSIFDRKNWNELQYKDFRYIK
jgi:YidC/Oxa1 family membrane protein insertase